MLRDSSEGLPLVLGLRRNYVASFASLRITVLRDFWEGTPSCSWASAELRRILRSAQDNRAP